jgi:carbon monoxide dehydrogenase subunit G
LSDEKASIMKISGVATMHAPAGRVWTALTDPAVLVVAIPGCGQLDRAGPDRYRFAVQAKVGSIEGSYTGEISASQRQEPSSFVLTVSGAGAPGTVSASVQVRLAETGGTTELSYDADAVIGGLIAGVGQRMLCSVAERMADEFCAAVDDVLAGTVLASTGVVSQAAPPTGPPVKPPAEPRAALAPAAPSAAPLVPAGLAPGGRVPAGPVPVAFARGVLVGAAVTLAGVAVAGLIGRRAR